jgi:hypothetical protein
MRIVYLVKALGKTSEQVADAHVDTFFKDLLVCKVAATGAVRGSICLNHFQSSPTRGPSRSCDIRSAAILSAHRHEFGLLRNRPDASLFLRARWIAQTRRCFGAANDRRNPVNRLIKKTVLHAVDDTSPILAPKGTGEFTFGDHLRHLHEHAGTIPATLDEFGRCAHCVRRGWFKPDA